MNERFKERLVRLMREKQVDAMMIAPSEELRFLAGFNVYQDERFQALFLTAKGGAFYICNILSRDEVAEGMGEPIPVHTWTDSEDFAAVAGDVLEEYGLLEGTVGVNSTVRAFNLIPVAERTGIRFVNGKE